MKRLKNVIILILSCIIFISCSTKDNNDIDKFTSNIIEALKEDNLEMFRENCVSIQIFKLAFPHMTEDEYLNILSDLYYKVQNKFVKGNINIKEYEIFEVRKPHSEHDWKNFKLIRYYVILKNSEGKYIKIEFIDCLKSKEGYFFGERIELLNE